MIFFICLVQICVAVIVYLKLSTTHFFQSNEVVLQSDDSGTIRSMSLMLAVIIRCDR